jgi:hypothetical protein
MGLIVQSAWLALCKCGQHGVIAFGDGSKSEEFFSKEDAFAEVETALLAKKMIPAEAEFLRKEIAGSAIMTQDKIDALRTSVKVLVHLKPGDTESAEHPAAGPTLH